MSKNFWKVDYLEAKYKGLPARFTHTKKMVKLSNVPKKLLGLKDEKEIDDLIDKLKREEFDKKWHAGKIKLLKAVKAKGSCPLDDHLLVVSQLTNVLMRVVSDANLPKWVNLEASNIINEKTDLYPDKFNASLDNDPLTKKFLSNVWVLKQARKALIDIEWSFKMIQGNISREDREKHQEDTGKPHKPKLSFDRNVQIAQESVEKDNNLVPEYKGMIASLEDDYFSESDEEATVRVQRKSVLDNFHQGEERDEHVPSPELRLSKHKLPAFAFDTGYISGGSDSEDEEKTQKTPIKKNRPGQRARQKIWEQKYGLGAAHIRKQREKDAKERSERQAAFEARENRRLQRAQQEAEKNRNNPNMMPIGERKDGTVEYEQKVHPSWEAKRKAKEQLQKTAFTGKKIKFD